MSKKCCGMIYSDDEKICKVCGKPLDEAAQTEVEEAVEEDTADEAENIDEIETIDVSSTEVEEEEEKTEEETDYDPEDKHRTSDGKVDYLKKHIEREAILDQIYDDNSYKKKTEVLEEKDKVPFKGAAVFTLILAILGMVLIGVLIYFIVLNPYYIKSGEADKKLDYPQLASSSDAEELSVLLEPYGATASDAEEE